MSLNARLLQSKVVRCIFDNQESHMSSERVTLEEFLHDRRQVNPLKRAGVRTFEDLLEGIRGERHGGYYFLTSHRQVGALHALRILVKLESEGYITRKQFGLVPEKAWKRYENDDEGMALIAQIETLRARLKALEARMP